MMVKFIFLLGLALGANAFEHNSLKVKYSNTTDGSGGDGFIEIPRTIKAAESEGYVLTERPDGPYQGLIEYCRHDKTICPLYTPAGFIAGLQIGMLVQDYTPASTEPQQMFTKWTPPATADEPSLEYYTATQYYLSEEDFEAGEFPTEEIGTTLQKGGVWVVGPDLEIMKIPATEEEIQQTLYTKQNCIANMGTHYYRNMTKSMDCNKFYPWFGLFTEQKMIGCGFQVIGKMVNQTELPTVWFEKFTNGATGIPATIPISPPCLTEWILTYNVISLHIYYNDAPWELVCNDSDSIDPSTIPAS